MIFSGGNSSVPNSETGVSWPAQKAGCGRRMAAAIQGKHFTFTVKSFPELQSRDPLVHPSPQHTPPLTCCHETLLLSRPPKGVQDSTTLCLPSTGCRAFNQSEARRRGFGTLLCSLLPGEDDHRSPHLAGVCVCVCVRCVAGERRWRRHARRLDKINKSSGQREARPVRLRDAALSRPINVMNMTLYCRFDGLFIYLRE